MPTDPWYESAPYEWARARIKEATGYDVVVDDNLGDKVLNLDHDERAISLLPGQTMFQVAGLLTLATWRVIGGPEWVPAFRVTPRLRAIPSQRSPINNVVELQSCPTCNSAMRRA